ncbi:hypothetical protein CAI21_09310 [Alkalilimnicola ehrlichii]|uniref:DUF72 domain-containing protein n=1 Tax=Alkalilimnicola ehrlichii TaxID=351052 RepID=A0A3E0WUX7_9GAMM|nr:DUF72 domain-containing protein [Alkalilimnicola ehrlichii]RFA29273.1 hypothetical protein CAI21_09310 [Alkalilimnicola ehrlichii]RFA36790.1 hypothetical protein CAL65_09655 [Alkalilimnicola ehrlichii]
MQPSLFADQDHASGSAVRPIHYPAAVHALGEKLPAILRLGTSSWHYPGWAGLVWDKVYSEAQLSRDGLPAYAEHPLFRTVGVDRGFYRPLTQDQYAAYAAQVPVDFRFVVKAPALITDALVRGAGGQGRKVNPHFLDAEAAVRDFAAPALAGLGDTLGALVFQISPLPRAWRQQMPRLIDRLRDMLRALPDLKAQAPDAVVAVEVRDPEWLTPEFVTALKDTSATYCLGLHPKMPPIAEQLPILRALWPGPLVCRWNVNPIHGAYGYEAARDKYAPYDRLQDEDVATRTALTKVIQGTVGAGQLAYVTLSNKAEGCAPLSVEALAQTVAC